MNRRKTSLSILLLIQVACLLGAVNASADSLQCWNMKDRGASDPLFTAKVLSDNRIADIRFLDSKLAPLSLPGEMSGHQIDAKTHPFFGYNEFSSKFWLMIPKKISIESLAKAARIGTAYGKGLNGLLAYPSQDGLKLIRLICYTDSFGGSSF